MVDAHILGKEITTTDITRMIIGGQTGVDGIRFCIASTVNGEDLTDPLFSWYLQFKNKNGQGEPVLLAPVYEDSLIKLPWIPGTTATQVYGRLQIQIFAAKTEGVGEAAVLVKQWVSAPAVVYVEENLNPFPIIPAEPSIFESYLTMYASFKDAAESAAAAALASEQAASASEGNASGSAAAALASEQAASTSEGNASGSAAAALAIYGSTLTMQEAAAAALASEQAAGTSEDNAALSAAAALASEQAASTSEGNADTFSQTAYGYKETAIASANNAEGFRDQALISKNEAEVARAAAVGAAAVANGWMLIDGQKYVVSREAKNGHILKTVSLYVEAP